MFSMVLSMATVVAQDDGDDPETEDRDVSVEINDYDVRITSEREAGDFKDEFTATIDADGDATTGWQTPDDYATNGAEYQFECYAADAWGGLYPWGSDPATQDWPWLDGIADDDSGDEVFTNSVLVGDELEFSLKTSLKNSSPDKSNTKKPRA